MLISAVSRKLDRLGFGCPAVEEGKKLWVQPVAAGRGKAMKTMERDQEGDSTWGLEAVPQAPNSIFVLVAVFRLRMHVAGSTPVPVHCVA
jgi:hypothetical protein